MIMNIISLNTAGLNYNKLSSIIHTFKFFHPIAICLQETFTSSSFPLNSFEQSRLSQLWSGQIYFSKHLVTLISHNFKSTLFFISSDQRIMDITISSSSSSFNLRNIYAPADFSLNRSFWHSFPPIPSSPIIVAGDFNTAVSLRDRWNSNSNTFHSPFSSLMPTHFPNLVDLASSSQYPKFTFFRNYSSYSSKSRIDFILLSPSLIKPTHSSFTHFVPFSDHRAVIIKQSPIPHSTPLHWKMNTSYLCNSEIQDNISNILLSHTPPSSPSDWDLCKQEISTYYRSISASFSKKSRSAIINLSNRIVKLQNSPHPNNTKIIHLKKALSKLQHKQTISLAIRSRVRWFEQGEKSSAYFFSQYKQHQQNINIDELYIPAPSNPSSFSLSQDNTLISSHILSHFSNLWSSSFPSPPLDSPFLQHIPHLLPSSYASLNNPITHEELYDAIKSKEDHSSPGPDGLPYKFYKLFPTLISNILIPIFSMISSGLFPPPLSWSETTTILIPKKNSDPHYVSNLRPITLSNTDIKLLSTILASRFQSHASYLIHPSQTGFMKSRNIYDTILDINYFSTIPDPPPESFLLSVDWSKAYDRVSHSWLDLLLNSIFPLSFVYLTQCSYHNRSTSFQLNSSLSPSLPIHQGVPQGDPFSPLLFNLSIEPLFNYIRSFPTLVIRAYADDTTIFGHSINDYYLLQQIFSLYQSCTAGTINLQKSSIFPLSPLSFPSLPPDSPPIVSSLNILGFLLPINSSNTSILWQSLLHKIRHCLSTLSFRHLSLKGRILVTKSLILSKVWYQVPISPPPADIQRTIQSLINSYIWNKSHVHPSFEVATLPLLSGGINFPDFSSECHIRIAKLIARCFDPEPPVWIKCLNLLTLNSFQKSLPNLILNNIAPYSAPYPIKSILSSAKKIHLKSPLILATSPSLPSLRNIMRYNSPLPLSPFSPSHYIGPLSWKEIHNPNYPRKVSDLLWKIAHQILPIGLAVSKICPSSSSCPWCHHFPLSISHLFHSCSHASLIWSRIIQLCNYFHHNSNPSTLLHSPHLKQFRFTARLLISAALWTIWTDYTSYAFSHSPLSSSDQSLNSLLSFLITYRHLHPPTPHWPSPTQIATIILYSH